jgi:diguanylate cyclase (GGDEF)-like protein
VIPPRLPDDSAVAPAAAIAPTPSNPRVSRPAGAPAGTTEARTGAALASRLDAAARVRLFIAAIAAVAVVGYVTVVSQLPAYPVPFQIPWPIFALVFYLGEVNVVEIHFLRERHSFSLSELPGIAGLFLLPPDQYLLALLTGTGLALLTDSHQSPIKRSFNLAQFGLLGVVSLIVFHALASPTGMPGPSEWLAAFLTAAVTGTLGAVLVATVISLSGGAPQYKKLPEMLRFSGMVAIANTSLALLAVMVLWVDLRSIVLLFVPIAIVFAAYRAYVREREKHERLELLYESSRLLHYAPELDSAIVAVLDHARKMFRAERVELVLFPDPTAEAAMRSSSDLHGPGETMVETRIALDDTLRRRVTTEGHSFRATLTADWTAAPGLVHEAVIGPMVGERGVLGAITIINRIGEGSSFAADDERLLETVANQVAVALENGQLEQSLHELSTLKEELRHQAFHDPLTGLANRPAFVEQVDRRILAGATDPTGEPTSVVFLDLDDFKVVNDTLGHAAGDQLLEAVAERLREQLRAGDLLARFGGDEFAILPASGTTVAEAMTLAERVVGSLALPFPVSGTDIVVGGSAGIGVARAGQPTEELLRDADVAMYRAKSNGKRRVEVFDPKLHRAIVERHRLTSDLARSVSRGELVVHYQPIVALSDGRVVGVEALARWEHPLRGPVDPAEFIALAEENGTILALGRSILEVAAAQVAAWQRIGPADLGLSVNLSPLQLQHPGFIAETTAIVEDAGLRPDALTLEMTETAMFRDAQATIAKLEALRARGIRIAMDDFGTGYSSLAYLRRFPVDSLKIAREFIGGPPDTTEADAWVFARAIIALGQSLGLPIVAEGIETIGQLEALRRLQCGLGQGYLFGEPMGADELEARLYRGYEHLASA